MALGAFDDKSNKPGAGDLKRMLGRTILYMTPRKGHFLVGFVLGEYAEGRGVRIEIRNKKILGVTKQLAAIKTANRNVFRHSWLILLLLASAGCAGGKATHEPIGTSDLEVLPPAPGEPLPEGYKPKLRPPESPPETLDQPLPDYPESALPDEVGCVARLLYHILKDGSATLVRLEWDEPPPPEHQGSFEDSIREAMLGWRFIPAKKWVPTKMEDGSTTTVPQAIPKAERAIVRFRVEDGRGVVE